MRAVSKWTKSAPALAALVLVTLTAASRPALAADDPFDGEWKIDLARSQAAAQEPESAAHPINMTIKMETVGQVVHYDSETSYPGGRVSQTHYAANYDGSLAMVTGSHGLLAPVSLARIDANTVEASYIRGFQVVAKSRRVVSPDGAIMTITTTSEEPGSKSTVSVFVKVKEEGAKTDLPALLSIVPSAAAQARSCTGREVVTLAGEP